MALHVFVVMPFGVKGGIDFDKVYSDYIKPALEGEDYEVFRADEERCGGNILEDMFQELLLADLVIADLSIDNPNVWYELGVRHALRSSGIVLIQSKRDYQPFDLAPVRKCNYNIKDGLPDPAVIDKDKSALASMARMTMATWHGHRISPVYHMLPYLREPEWKSLRVGNVRKFWQKHDAWEMCIKIAEQKRYPGDIIVLAAEAPVLALQLEAYRIAGKSLVKLGQFAFAFEQYKKALDIDSEDLESKQQTGVILGRLQKYVEARIHLEKLVKDNPGNAESLALLGRVEKDAWTGEWRKDGRSVVDMQKEAVRADALLRESIKAYARGFVMEPAHYYSGINAVTLIRLLHHLAGDESLLFQCKEMEGGIRWALKSVLSKETLHNKDFWARVTLGDLDLLVSEQSIVERSYRDAVVAADNWFSLDSSRQQLHLLRDLGFRPEVVSSVLALFDHAIEKFEAPITPRQVFLFSGHLIDAPDRATPRFPAEKESVAAQRIAEALDQLGAGPVDLALTQGACGGDLLFTEACLKRGVKVNWLQPFHEAEFIRNSVVCCAEGWRKRYYDAKLGREVSIRSAPEALGAMPSGAREGYPYERCNLWLLYTALSYGIDKVRFVCLWNGGGGDGPGGTAHMYNEVNQRTGQVTWIDTRTL
jgi:tetratricopeptide (TPR) repeat protein